MVKTRRIAIPIILRNLDHVINNFVFFFVGTIMTKTSFWKQLANVTSTDLSVIFKAFWATVPRKFIKWLIWNWKKKKKIDFFIHMKKEIVKKLKRNCFTKLKKTEKRKSFQAIDGSHPPTYSKSERRLAPPKSVGSKSASHEKRIQVRASLAEKKLCCSVALLMASIWWSKILLWCESPSCC